MSICALVGSTDFNSEHFSSQRFDCVIAVDAGYESLASIGCEPDLVVGDFDSLGYVPDGTNVQVHPSVKDESDMELAIRLAESRGCESFLMYGALAARLDHTIANLQLLVGCARRGMRAFGIGSDFAVAALDGTGANALAFDAFDPQLLDAGSYGRFVSVFAFGGQALGVCETGMKYQLRDAVLSDDVSRGLSNEFTGSATGISLAHGSIVVTFGIGAWDHLIEAL